jgi:hypothetical protein
MLQVGATGIERGSESHHKELLGFYKEILSKHIHSNISSNFYFALMQSIKIQNRILYAWELHDVSSLNYQRFYINLSILSVQNL